MSDLVKKEATVPEVRRTVASLHEYLSYGQKNTNIASKILTDLQLNKGIGKNFVIETDQILYHYSGNPLYYVFSRAGRVIVIIARPALALTKDRLKTIYNRFLTLDRSNGDNVLIEHFEELIKMSNSKNYGKVSSSFVKGEFTVHMRDLINPFIEIGKAEDIPLVVPLSFITELCKSNIIPHSNLWYQNQNILLATNDDYTIRVLYSSHLLNDQLFKGNR